MIFLGSRCASRASVVRPECSLPGDYWEERTGWSRGKETLPSPCPTPFLVLTQTFAVLVACEQAHLCEFGENFFGGGARILHPASHSPRGMGAPPPKIFPKLTHK